MVTKLNNILLRTRSYSCYLRGGVFAYMTCTHTVFHVKACHLRYPYCQYGNSLESSQALAPDQLDLCLCPSGDLDPNGAV